MTTGSHGRTRHSEPLYDMDIPTPTHAERARTLVAGIGTATLCTQGMEPAGFPYGSFVTAAFDGPDPVFLLSELAEHTKNLRQDARASVMFHESGAADPLANGRVTLVGECSPQEQSCEAVREAFLAAHPNASYYADFTDFSFWKLEVQAIRYIGGYGRMSWVSAEDWRAAEPDPLAGSAAMIVGHMNDGHKDALPLYCRAFSKATEAEDATMTGVDRYGFELSVTTDKGPRPVRLAFPEPVADVMATRKALVAMLGEAREKLGIVKPA